MGATIPPMEPVVQKPDILVRAVDDATPALRALSARMPGDDRPTYLVEGIACGYCGRRGRRGSQCSGCGATVEPFPAKLPRPAKVPVPPAWAVLLQPDVLLPLIALAGGLLAWLGLIR